MNAASTNIPSFLTDRESTDLDFHVRVCAERYNGLNERMDSLEKKVDELADKIDGFRSDLYKVMIGTAGTIITAVITGIFLIYSK